MKKRYLIGALICAALGAIFLFWFLRPFVPSGRPVVPSASVSYPAASPPPSDASASASSSASVSEPAPDLSEPPAAFAEQQKINGDIYAWIRVPGTVVDYPVLQHKSNDAYYLDHDIRGRSSVGGALFTERAYNGKSFTDPVTVIYGHKLKSGAMFGGLQALYSDPDGFAQNRRIDVWLTDASHLQYEIFAALPYDNRHILYSYDFNSERVFKNFFKNILSTRALGANFDTETAPIPGDHVLILSTCLKGDNTRRYLVMAKQIA